MQNLDKLIEGMGDAQLQGLIDDAQAEIEKRQRLEFQKSTEEKRKAAKKTIPDMDTFVKSYNEFNTEIIDTFTVTFDVHTTIETSYDSLLNNYVSKHIDADDLYTIYHKVVIKEATKKFPGLKDIITEHVEDMCDNGMKNLTPQAHKVKAGLHKSFEKIKKKLLANDLWFDDFCDGE